MTTPALSLLRFWQGLLTGAVLGGCYGFLRPLRPKYTTLADSIFVLAALYGWIFLQFRLCGGDIRMACSIAMGIGFLLWDHTAGRLLRPAFTAFWTILGKIRSLFLYPFKKTLKMTKILFASVKNGLQ